jgi:hypothetical protein
MTPRQKRIIGVLAIANGAVILALALFVVRFSSATSAMPLPWSATPHSPAGPEEALYPEACQRRAVQLLSQAGLGGTAAVLSGETLQLDLVYPIPQDQDAEEAAQQVWTAFDIARALSQDPCGDFSHVTVVIQAQGARGEAVTQSSIQIHASVDTTDLEALHNGELSEGEFIDRVQYEAH